MRLLHTSDWHLGRTLYGRKRDEEFEQLLQWVVLTVRAQTIDVLVIAGDIFDTATPGTRAQRMYYQFLYQMVASPCRHIVIVAGNHDSAAFLNAPADLLKAFDVHVVGQACEDVSEQIVVLRDEHGQPQMVVCAVPYLRDRDVRTVALGETIEDKDRNLVQGIRDHYARVAQAARQVCLDLGCQVPIVATGHLYAAGGQVIEGDGVRDLYIGSLGQVHASMFSEVFDYVALGHLHVPQIVDGQSRIRYSGSPLPMGFGEARQTKSVCLVSFQVDPVSERLQPVIETLTVPVFQRLCQVRGNFGSIRQQIDLLAQSNESWWVEVIYEGHEVISDLRQQIEQLVVDSQVELLRIKTAARLNPRLVPVDQQESLDDLTPMQVFERCLDAYEVPATQRHAMQHTFEEALAMVRQGAQPAGHPSVVSQEDAHADT